MPERIRAGGLASGAVAIPVIRALEESHEIALLFINTQPDKKAGRKGELTPTPVGTYAEERGLKLYKENVNSPAFAAVLEEMPVDILVVFDFGQLLKEPVLNAPRLGCLNIHGSLLPAYRGASPIQSAILNGETQSGITFMKMNKGLDTGDVYCSYVLPITHDMQSPALYEAVGNCAGQHICDVVARIARGELHPVAQDAARATVCGKIAKTDGLLDFTSPSRALLCRINAFVPWPGTYFTLRCGTKQCKIAVHTAATVPLDEVNAPLEPGRVAYAPKGKFYIRCADALLDIRRLQPEGKKIMEAQAFLNGMKLQPAIDGAIKD